MTARPPARRAIAAWIFGAWALLGSTSAFAGELEERFGRASAALAAGSHDAAILELEVLADRGLHHPDASFDRGLAYWMRARSEAAQPGDMGRAAAGFEEARRLDPSDEDAALHAELVRAEVRAKRHRADKDDPIVRPSLDRVVLLSLTPRTWAALAFLASVALAVGLLLRRRPSGPVHVAGSIATAVGAVALVTFGPLAFAAGRLVDTRGEAVVVVPEVSLRDAAGKPVEAPTLPEATTIEIGARRGDLIEARWGSYEGLVPWSAVRILAPAR